MTIKKPTIFFSHSSKDKEIMVRLKDAFVEKTGGTIDVFLSSDGQSIPLGRNWVHKVQEGLENAALLIVFITPNSLNSNWVHFEAGYSYSKEIKVVPIGFLGIDLSRLSPPLSLLQGFNLTSFETLNNLIALTNEEFNYSHQLSFEEGDYSSITGGSNSLESNLFGFALDFVDEIKVSINIKDSELDHVSEITKILKSDKIEYKSNSNSIILRGVNILISDDDLRQQNSIDFKIDPLVFETFSPALEKIITAIKKKKSALTYYFSLSKNVDVIEKLHKITARLCNDPISFELDQAIYKKISFDTGYYYSFSASSSSRNNAYIKVTSKNKLNVYDTAALLELLIKRDILTKSEPNLLYMA